MARRSCDGAGLLGAFRAAAAALEASVDEVNALNVFPVPDGDTGSNMMATVRAALAEAEGLGPTVSAERVASAAAFGALMGARGNSGVITSQILRGLAEGLAGKTKFNALDLANALDQGTKAAYGAVAKPVEGTILTVIREASAAAVEVAERERTLEAVMKTTVDAAQAAVAKTPSLLPILREAGVVDSGGQGLFRMMEGALRVPERRRGGAGATAARRRGGRRRRPSRARARPTRARRPGPACATRASGSRRCSSPRRRPGSRSTSTGSGTTTSRSASPSSSRATPRAIKVHIHNERPDLVLALRARARDAVEDQRREPRPAGERRARDARRGVRRRGLRGRDRHGAAAARRPRSSRLSRAPTRRELAVVAVAAGEGLAAIFRDFGVHRVVYGGQTANPSTGELLEAVKSVDAHEVLLLPNNPNIVLAARQVSAMSDRPVAVVATRNAAEGFAALLALDPDKSALENAGEMTTAGRAIQSLSVTQAVRDATIGGRKVKLGQTIALDPDDGLVAVHDDPTTAVLEAIKSLSAGLRADHGVLRRRRRPRRHRGARAAGSTTSAPARRSRCCTVASRTTAT